MNILLTMLSLASPLDCLNQGLRGLKGVTESGFYHGSNGQLLFRGDGDESFSNVLGSSPHSYSPDYLSRAKAITRGSNDESRVNRFRQRIAKLFPKLQHQGTLHPAVLEDLDRWVRWKQRRNKITEDRLLSWDRVRGWLHSLEREGVAVTLTKDRDRNQSSSHMADVALQWVEEYLLENKAPRPIRDTQGLPTLSLDENPTLGFTHHGFYYQGNGGIQYRYYSGQGTSVLYGRTPHPLGAGLTAIYRQRNSERDTQRLRRAVATFAQAYPDPQNPQYFSRHLLSDLAEYLSLLETDGTISSEQFDRLFTAVRWVYYAQGEGTGRIAEALRESGVGTGPQVDMAIQVLEAYGDRFSQKKPVFSRL